MVPACADDRGVQRSIENGCPQVCDIGVQTTVALEVRIMLPPCGFHAFCRFEWTAIFQSFGGAIQFDGQRSSAFSTICRNFKADVMPIETWSSLPPDVGTLSTLAGWASTLASFSSAARQTCAII